MSKEFFGLISILLAVVGDIPYYKDVIRGKTRPHSYSWLVWAILAIVALGIQFQNNAGPGWWLQAITTLSATVMFLISLKLGHKDVKLIDKLSLIFALVAFVLWVFVKAPLAAAILISLVEAIGAFLPTFRKAYNLPNEETSVTYLTYAFSLVFSLLAMSKYSLVNLIYPVVVLILCFSMFLFLIIRRRVLYNKVK